MELNNDFFRITATEPLDGGGAATTVELNAGHPIYKAHFPGNPVTPGVCIVQMVGELAQEAIARRLELKRIANVKFVAAIDPVKSPRLKVAVRIAGETADEVKISATVADGERTCAKLSIVYAYA